jgi:uncharacterized protein (UPF0335 family)
MDGNALLKSYVDRIENLEEEKKGISDDIKDVYTEAASSGFDKKALRAVIRLRKLDKNERDELQSMMDTYITALETV